MPRHPPRPEYRAGDDATQNSKGHHRGAPCHESADRGWAIENRRCQTRSRRGHDHGYRTWVPRNDEYGEDTRQSPKNAGGELTNHALFD